MSSNRPVSCFGAFLLFSLLVAGRCAAQSELADVFRKVQRSVVVIVTIDRDGSPLGIGSGFFINKEGDLITSLHVLLGARAAGIKLSNGQVFTVTGIVAADGEGDLVCVSTDVPSHLAHPLPIRVTPPTPGDRILVVGTPHGLEFSVSDGIIAAVRPVSGVGRFLQITAPISPGSSGSPVFNMNGEVLGVVSFQITKGQNLNFAIASERLVQVIPSPSSAASTPPRRPSQQTGPAPSPINKSPVSQPIFNPLVDSTGPGH